MSSSGPIASSLPGAYPQLQTPLTTVTAATPTSPLHHSATTAATLQQYADQVLPAGVQGLLQCHLQLKQSLDYLEAYAKQTAPDTAASPTPTPLLVKDRQFYATFMQEANKFIGQGLRMFLNEMSHMANSMATVVELETAEVKRLSVQADLVNERFKIKTKLAAKSAQISFGIPLPKQRRSKMTKQQRDPNSPTPSQQQINSIDMNALDTVGVGKLNIPELSNVNFVKLVSTVASTNSTKNRFLSFRSTGGPSNSGTLRHSPNVDDTSSSIGTGTPTSTTTSPHATSQTPVLSPGGPTLSPIPLFSPMHSTSPDNAAVSSRPSLANAATLQTPPSPTPPDFSPAARSNSNNSNGEFNPSTRRSRASLKATDLFKSMSNPDSLPVDASNASPQQASPANEAPMNATPNVTVNTNTTAASVNPNGNPNVAKPRTSISQGANRKSSLMAENFIDMYDTNVMNTFIGNLSRTSDSSVPGSSNATTSPTSVLSPYIPSQQPQLDVATAFSPLGVSLEAAMYRLSFAPGEGQRQRQQQQQQPQLPEHPEEHLVTLLADFTAEMPEEMSAKTGEVLRLLQPDDNGWTYVETLDGERRGLVPSSYVKDH